MKNEDIIKLFDDIANGVITPEEGYRLVLIIKKNDPLFPSKIKSQNIPSNHPVYGMLTSEMEKSDDRDNRLESKYRISTRVFIEKFNDKGENTNSLMHDIDRNKLPAELEKIKTDPSIVSYKVHNLVPAYGLKIMSKSIDQGFNPATVDYFLVEILDEVEGKMGLWDVIYKRCNTVKELSDVVTSYPTPKMVIAHGFIN